MTGQTGGDDVGSLAQEAWKLARALADQVAEVADPAEGESAAHRPESCDYCPLCQLIAIVRHARPEVAEHLTAALTSLTLAARGVVESWAQMRDEQAAPAEGAARGEQDIDVEDGSWH